MKNLKYFFVFVFLSCNKTSSYSEKDFTSIKYYETFSGYNHPLSLISEIRKEETIHKKAYYIGYFRNNKLMKVEKFLDNDLFFFYEYFYEKDKLVKAILSNKEGKKTLKIEN